MQLRRSSISVTYSRPRVRNLQDMAGRCPGLGQALLRQQLAQQACVSTIRFHPPLPPTQVCRVGRLDKLGFRRDHSITDERGDLVYMVRDA